MHKFHIILGATLSIIIATLTYGCIKNDIPYPRIQANFLTFEAAGQDRGAAIDSAARTVTLYFGEETDIQNIEISEYTITPGAELLDFDLNTPLNLSKPINVVLHLYQNWTWTISAIQNIERYFDVTNQVGSSFIDVPGKRVIVYISSKNSLSKVHVERAKLGPVGSITTPSLNDATIDLSRPLEVAVEAYGRVERWTIFAEQVTSSVTTQSVDAWTNVAWVYGRATAGAANGFEYRIKGDTEWIPVPESDIISNGGDFHARIIHLSSQTTYEARAISDGQMGEVIEFTTGQAIQLPNSNFDEWWLDRKVWNPWAEDGTQYWDTGNKGAATLGESNSYPTEETVSGTGWAACLQTRFVGIGVLGKIAAGNIFVGLYYRTDGTNGILHFGRPFSERPTKLKGYLKYNPVPIDYASDEMSSLIGQPDTCIVWCALIDQDSPFEIRTNPKNRQLFDPDGSYVVGYGKIQFGQAVSAYTPFEFEIEYKSTSRVPKYILVTASASKYGDYFTGGNGSTLYLDDLELVYDY